MLVPAIVARDQQAAFEDRQTLARREAVETDIANRAGEALPDAGAERLCGVLDGARADRMRDGVGRRYVGQAPAKMRRHDGERVLVARGGESLRVHVEMPGLEIDQARHQTRAADRQWHERTGERRNDDVAPRACVLGQRAQRDRQCRGPGALELRLFDAEPVRRERRERRGRRAAQVGPTQRQAGGGRGFALRP